MNDGKAGWITENAFNSFVNAKKKLRAQTDPLIFIPNDRISKLLLRLWMKENSHARTS